MPLSTPLPLYAESDIYAVYHAVDPEAATAHIGVDRWLLNNGLNYAKVALVKAPLNDVPRLTRNKGRVPWTENAAVVWYDDLQPDLRETRSGDVILARHGAWLVTLSSLHPIVYPSAVPLVTYHGHGFVVSSVSWSHNMASIASGDWDGGVRVWDANSARETLSYSHRQGPVSRVVWSPDSEEVASANPAVVLTYRVSGGKFISLYEGHQLPLYDLWWARDGLLFCVGGEQGSVSLLNATNRSRVFRFRARRDTVEAAVISQDGRRIAFAYEGEQLGSVIEVGNTSRPGVSPAVFRDHPLQVRCIAFSPDGSLAASTGNDGAGTGGMVRIWDTSTGKRRKLCVLSTYVNLSQAENGAYALAWSPDGKYLATANADSSVQIFDVTTGGQVAAYHGHRTGAFAVAFSSDGKFIASGGGDNTVQVWRWSA